MRNRILGVLGIWLAGAAAALAQPAGPAEYMGLTSAHDLAPAGGPPAATGPIQGMADGPYGCKCGDLDPADRSKVYFGAEYLLWWYKHDNMPPLVAAVPASDLTATAFNPATIVRLFPGTDGLNFNAFSGARFNGGVFLDDCHNFGIDGTVFWLPKKDTSYSIASGGDPVIGRPFLNTQTGTVSFLTLAQPNIASGFISAKADTELWGFDVNARVQGPSFLSQYFDMLFGFRYFELKENLTINDSTTRLLDGSMVASTDSLGARNQFYGAQIGGHAHYCCYDWTLDVIDKIALGDMHQRVDIEGSTSANIAGLPPVVIPNGLYSQPARIGTHNRDKVGFIEELNVDLGYQVTKNFRVFVGYNLMYITSVVRNRAAVDQTADPAQIPFYKPTVLPPVAGQPFTFNNARAGDFTAQGLSLGLALRY